MFISKQLGTIIQGLSIWQEFNANIPKEDSKKKEYESKMYIFFEKNA